MSFLAKTDFCGLATAYPTALAVRDDKANLSEEAYRPVDNDGVIFAEEIYGEDSAPANSYALKGSWTTTALAPLTVGAGAINTIDNKPYALASVTINTSAGSPVSVSATSDELEEGASTANAAVFVVPPFSLATTHKAQDIFGAIDTVTNATITQLNHVIGCTIRKDKLAGVKLSSGANTGLLTITGTLLQKSTLPNAAAVSITLNSGWTLAARPSRTNPESQYPEFAFTITRPLALQANA